MQEKNKLSLSVQYADPRLQDILPRNKLRRAVQAALQAPAELTLRFVDAAEGRTLNRDYRAKDYATNVLTFDYNEGDSEPLQEQSIARADIVLCTDVLQREAAEQGKTVAAHALHLLVHGVLHAQGYSHESEPEASEMEALETQILARLGIDNPYLDR